MIWITSISTALAVIFVLFQAAYQLKNFLTAKTQIDVLANFFALLAIANVLLAFILLLVALRESRLG